MPPIKLGLYERPEDTPLIEDEIESQREWAAQQEAEAAAAAENAIPPEIQDQDVGQVQQGAEHFMGFMDWLDQAEKSQQNQAPAPPAPVRTPQPGEDLANSFLQTGDTNEFAKPFLAAGQKAWDEAPKFVPPKRDVPNINWGGGAPGANGTAPSGGPDLSKGMPGSWDEAAAYVADRARAAGLGEEGAKAAVAVLKTEGGWQGKPNLTDAARAGGTSEGGFQLNFGGQNPGVQFAQAMGMSNAEAVAYLRQNPLAATDFWLQGHLGKTIKEGMQQGLSGAELATYAQRHGQVSVHPETAGANYMALFGAGQSAPSPQHIGNVPTGTQDPAKAVEIGLKEVGKPYSGPLVGQPQSARWGDPGWDCSSFVAGVYAKMGIKLTPFTDTAAAETVKVDDPQPGDIIFYKYSDSGQPNVQYPHMGIYMGNNQMLDAQGGKGVGVHPLLNRPYEIRRPKGVEPGEAAPAAVETGIEVAQQAPAPPPTPAGPEPISSGPPKLASLLQPQAAEVPSAEAPPDVQPSTQVPAQPTPLVTSTAQGRGADYYGDTAINTEAPPTPPAPGSPVPVDSPQGRPLFGEGTLVSNGSQANTPAPTPSASAPPTPVQDVNPIPVDSAQGQPLYGEGSISATPPDNPATRIGQAILDALKPQNIPGAVGAAASAVGTAANNLNQALPGPENVGGAALGRAGEFLDMGPGGRLSMRPEDMAAAHEANLASGAFDMPDFQNATSEEIMAHPVIQSGLGVVGGGSLRSVAQRAPEAGVQLFGAGAGQRIFDPEGPASSFFLGQIRRALKDMPGALRAFDKTRAVMRDARTENAGRVFTNNDAIMTAFKAAKEPFTRQAGEEFISTLGYKAVKEGEGARLLATGERIALPGAEAAGSELAGFESAAARQAQTRAELLPQIADAVRGAKNPAPAVTSIGARLAEKFPVRTAEQAAEGTEKFFLSPEGSFHAIDKLHENAAAEAGLGSLSEALDKGVTRVTFSGRSSPAYVEFGAKVPTQEQVAALERMEQSHGQPFIWEQRGPRTAEGAAGLMGEGADELATALEPLRETANPSGPGMMRVLDHLRQHIMDNLHDFMPPSAPDVNIFDLKHEGASMFGLGQLITTAASGAAGYFSADEDATPEERAFRGLVFGLAGGLGATALGGLASRIAHDPSKPLAERAIGATGLLQRPTPNSMAPMPMIRPHEQAYRQKGLRAVSTRLPNVNTKVANYVYKNWRTSGVTPAQRDLLLTKLQMMGHLGAGETAQDRVAKRFLSAPPKLEGMDRLAYLKSLSYTSMLIGPRTLGINVLGGMAELAGKAALDFGVAEAGTGALAGAATGYFAGDKETRVQDMLKGAAAGAGVGFAAGPGRRLLTNPLYRRQMAGEIAGAQAGFMYASQSVARLWAHGPDAVLGGDLSQGPVRNLGENGALLELVSTAMTSSDEFIRNIAFGMELGRLAGGQAAKYAKGTRMGQFVDHTEFVTRLHDNMAAPTRAMLREAWDSAERVVYRGELTDFFGKWLETAGQVQSDNAVKAFFGHMILPFVRTVWHIQNRGLETSPIGLAALPFRAKNMTPAQRTEQLRRGLFGTALTTFIATQALDGNVSGAGPASQQERDMLHETKGWMPFSVHIGDKWIPYANLGPLAYPLALTATYVESGLLKASLTGGAEKIGKEAPDLEGLQGYAQPGAAGSELIFDAIGRMTNMFEDMNMMRGAREIFSVLGKPTDSGAARLAASLTTRFAPVQGGALGNTIGQMQDPYQRNPEGNFLEQYIQQLQTKSPIMGENPLSRENVAPQRDVLGTPQESRFYGPGGALLPISHQDEPKYVDSTIRTLADYGVTPGDRKSNIEGVKLTADQYEQYQTEAGALADKYISQAQRTTKWARSSTVERHDLLQQAISKANEEAAAQLVSKSDRQEHKEQTINRTILNLSRS
jgi:cell wall-associated NlpC family hydrolase